MKTKIKNLSMKLYIEYLVIKISKTLLMNKGIKDIIFYCLMIVYQFLIFKRKLSILRTKKAVIISSKGIC